MRRLHINPDDPDATTLADAVETLHAGGVVAYPTDTLYGLGVDPRQDEAVRKLYALKQRDSSAAVALIAGNLAQALSAGEFGPAEQRLAHAFWPGPLTVIVAAAPGISRRLLGADATIGVRVPAHAVARQLAIAAGTCITATSANVSGRPAAVAPDEVAASFGEALEILLDAGSAPGGPPSTIVRIVGGRPELVREGAIAFSRVLESLE